MLAYLSDHFHQDLSLAGVAENRLSGVFECPDLFPQAAPDGREMWVLLVSMGASPAEGGCRIQYFLGDYDGETFMQTEAIGQTLMLDKGFDDYAGVTYSGTPERIFLGWAANASYAGDVPAGFAGPPGRKSLVSRCRI